jgi:hypothetical protein
MQKHRSLGKQSKKNPFPHIIEEEISGQPISNATQAPPEHFKNKIKYKLK